jgi:hypothetical protein
MNKNKIGSIFLVAALALAGIGISYAGFTDTITIFGEVTTATVNIDVVDHSGTAVYKVWGPDAPPNELFYWEGWNFNAFDQITAGLAEYPDSQYELIAWSFATPDGVPPSIPGNDVVDPINGDYDVYLTWYNLFPCQDFKVDFVFQYTGSIPAKLWAEYELIDDNDGLLQQLLADEAVSIEAYVASGTPGQSWDINMGEPVDVGYQIHPGEYVYVKMTIHVPQNNKYQGLSGTFAARIGALQWNEDPNDHDWEPFPPGDDPSDFIEITDWCDLNEIRYNLDAHYVLMNDLDKDSACYDEFNTGDGWLPIGYVTDPFTGSFNGDNYTISNLFIDRDSTDYVGLFGYIQEDAVVKHVGLIDVNITGNRFVGGLIGSSKGTVEFCYSTGLVAGENIQVGGLIGNNGGNVEFCYSTVLVTGENTLGGLIGGNSGMVSNCSATGDINGGSYVGGLIGNNGGNSNVEFSYATGNVNGDFFVGGLIGRVGGSFNPIVESCYATGDTNGGSFVGGLIGSNDGYLNNSYATGETIGTESHAGGLIGYNVDNGIVNNSYANGNTLGNKSVGGLIGRNQGGMVKFCYAIGNVNGNERVGGLIGHNSGTVHNNYARGDVTRLSGSTDEIIGGFCGLNYQGSITYSYSTGSVYYEDTSDPTDKGFVGEDNTGSYNNNFFDNEASNQDTGTGATPKTTTEMQNYDTFNDADWDIAYSYTNLNDGYPYLGWQDDDETYTWFIFDASKIQIWTIEDLDNIRNDLTSSYVLMNDLDFDDDASYADPGTNKAGFTTGDGWEPIGNSFATRFQGTVDGREYTISNLFIDRDSTDNVGLFGYLGGVVHNLGVINANVRGKEYVGILVGMNNEGEIYNCYSTGVVSGSAGKIGGLVGRNFKGLISNCYSSASVSGATIGGLVGRNEGQGSVQGRVENSYATGTVSASTGLHGSGGLIGLSWATTKVSNCFAVGSVSGASEDYRGGLIGREGGTGSHIVENSFYDTETTGQTDTGKGTPKTTAEMQTFDTFDTAGWDIEKIGDWTNEIWKINDGLGYPRLGWQLP